MQQFDPRPYAQRIASIPDKEHTTEDQEVQYRQLVSRAVTQRLHSPSLSNINLKDLYTDSWEAWELRERLIARNKAKIEIEGLRVSWGVSSSVFLIKINVS